MIVPKSAFPVVIIPSLKAAKNFYLQHFGFEVAFENEWYLHLASASGIQIGFMLPDQPTQPEVFKPVYAGQGVIFSLEVADADAAYEVARTQGLDIVLTLRSEEWGQRHFSVRDPNGLFVDVVQAFEPTDAYQEGYAS